MPPHLEIQRRLSHLSRSMKAGLSPLWAVIAGAVVVVGGDLVITFAWGVRHWSCGLIIFLLVLLAVLAEGSYRLARGDEADRAEQLAALKRERSVGSNALEAARHLETLRQTNIDPAPTKTGLEVVIDDNKPTWFPGIGIILEIEFHVSNHDPVPHILRLSLEGSSANPWYHRPSGSKEDPEHVRFLHEYGRISESRRWELLPPRVGAGETVRGVHITQFAWDRARRLPDYTLIINDGRHEYKARPYGVDQNPVAAPPTA